MTRNYLYYDVLESTMSEIARLQDLDQSSALIVRAGRQTKGQGRGSNSWDSRQGGLWFSINITNRPLLQAFALFVGACLHKTLCQLFPLFEHKLRIKWPNDVYLGDQKLAGILCKYISCNSSYLVGIGVNTNNVIAETDLGASAVSLSDKLGFYLSNGTLMKFIISELDRQDAMEEKDYIAYCNSYLYGLGKMAILGDRETVEGIIRGLDSTGALVLETNDGRCKAFHFGTLRIK